MGIHHQYRGVLDSIENEKGKTKLKYVLTEEGLRADYPPIEIDKPVFIIGGELSKSQVLSSFVLETRLSLDQKLEDGTKEWSGTRLFMFPGGDSTLNRGKFITTTQGAIIPNGIQTYTGKTTISPKFNNKDGNEKPNDFMYTFVPSRVVTS